MGREKSSKTKKEELIKMGYIPIRKIAELAGVEKSTIHFYISKGLLPKPVMVSKQMALYPPETVERIKIIKQLQKRFLPLKEIKKILKDQKNIDIKEILTRIDAGILNEFKKEKKEEKKIDLPKNVLEELKKIGMIKDGGEFDNQILALVYEMREAGINEENGFNIKFMKTYIDICKKLTEIEFSEFNSKVIGKLPPEKIVEMAKIAIEKTSELIKILHKKFLIEKLEEITKDIQNQKK
ncbi:Mercuric resistance operon regulatory protein [bacterium HR19]|nr:Mercuric resistance operon regulatory protein [bacterium HR19]